MLIQNFEEADMRIKYSAGKLSHKEQTMLNIIFDVEIGIQSWYFATCSELLGYQELILSIQ